MKKHTLLILCLLISTQLWAGASTTVRLKSDIDLVVSGMTNRSFNLNSAKPSGDGGTESSPAKVYVPMNNPSVTAANYFMAGGVTDLYSPGQSLYTISFPLYLNATSSDFYLYVSVKDGSNGYKLAAKYLGGPFNGTTNSTIPFAISVKSLCDQLSGDCANFNTVSGTEKTYMAYFFLSTATPASLALGTVTDPATYTGGLYFQVNMSNRIYQSSQVSPSISRARAGDGRLILEYDSNASILKPKAVRVVSFGENPPGGATDLQPIQTAFSAGGTLVTTEYPYLASGQITVNNLPNSKDAYLAIVFEDLYQFGTVVSADVVGKPMAIQELLKDQSCFLLTAGFGEEHYVITYFRHFRDAVLAKSSIGRAFIGFYYDTAPKYALMIYEHESLRALIRGVGYTLYFIFNHISLVFLGSLFFLILCIYLYKKREKIKI